MIYTIWVRSKIVVNPDPQRRCYDGCHFSSESVWTGWSSVYSTEDLADARSSVETYRSINPSRQYKITDAQGMLVEELLANA